jgi:hypothetical protein
MFACPITEATLSIDECQTELVMMWKFRRYSQSVTDPLTLICFNRLLLWTTNCFRLNFETRIDSPFHVVLFPEAATVYLCYRYCILAETCKEKSARSTYPSAGNFQKYSFQSCSQYKEFEASDRVRSFHTYACHLLARWLAEPISSTLKMEAICSSETSVETQRTTQRHIPEDDTLHNHRCDNLKSYNDIIA